MEQKLKGYRDLVGELGKKWRKKAGQNKFMRLLNEKGMVTKKWKKEVTMAIGMKQDCFTIDLSDSYYLRLERTREGLTFTIFLTDRWSSSLLRCPL